MRGMLLSVLLSLTVIMLTARLVGALFRRFNQPAVIGEVVGGILLGPSLLAPQCGARLPIAGATGRSHAGRRRPLPARRILFMFLVGLQPTRRSARQRHATRSSSPPRLIVPFALGALRVGPLFDSAPLRRRASTSPHSPSSWARRSRSPRSRSSHGSSASAACSARRSRILAITCAASTTPPPGASWLSWSASCRPRRRPRSARRD